MKKGLFYAIIPFLFITILSCNKNVSLAPDTNPSPTTIVQDPRNIVGALHNRVLGSLLDNVKKTGNVQGIPSSFKLMSFKSGTLPSGSGGTKTVDYSASTLGQSSRVLVLQNPNFSGQQFTLDPAAITAVDQLIQNFGQNNVQARWTSSLSSTTINTLVSSKEKAMINEITAVFTTSFATNPSLAVNYTTIKSKLATIQSKYANTVFHGTDGELYAGLISIAASSNEYWSNQAGPLVNAIVAADILGYANGSPFALIKDPLRSQTPFIVADCIGYIAGWGSALWDDYSSGNLSAAGQNRRIGQGVIWGIAGSLGVLCKSQRMHPLDANIQINVDSIHFQIDTTLLNGNYPFTPISTFP